MATIVRINILGLLVLSFLEVAVPFNLDSQYPIVFEDPTVHPTRETYFGYSVLLYGSLNTKSWIMVGAPRANSTYERHLNVNEPGVVYRCPFWPPQKCEPLLLDKTGNDKYKYRRMFFWDLKDGAWIGAAMDVQPGPNGRVVVCGPRWTNQYYIYEREEFFILGVCYWFEAEDDVIDGKAVKLLPLLNDDRVVKVRRVNTIFDFGVGQCGISAHMPLKKGNEEVSELLLGATGILNWRGGTVLYEDKDALPSGGFNKRSVASPGDFANLYVPPSNPSPNNKLASFDYFGYQVSSGYFFDENELWYATSAPRAANILGKVIFYKKSLDNIHRHIMVDTNHHVMGIQCGEYFGASIAAGDINNDDYEDLIVGAPLYTIEGIPRADMDFGYEEGRISIFFGSKTKKMKEVQIMGKARGARFGSAVSYLGDLDSDGFGEIAVGAPYENDGCGVVYIYSGSVNGIITKPVQQLFAHDTYPLLRGFGISISPHPADIDRNGCTDVAVGAYKSGHVVVYRGRPVLRWKTKTPYSTPRLPRNATHINLFGACITYLGNYVPNNLTMAHILDRWLDHSMHFGDSPYI
ncbi:integrin alpha-PS4-like [Hetaerina americana]|uniref:integrin alpha-PS4-like n=1 Tax=Hetaerina americana TaxID=62018 RepID=UPI003A7F2862